MKGCKAGLDSVMTWSIPGTEGPWECPVKSFIGLSFKRLGYDFVKCST